MGAEPDDEPGYVYGPPSTATTATVISVVLMVTGFPLLAVERDPAALFIPQRGEARRATHQRPRARDPGAARRHLPEGRVAGAQTGPVTTTPAAVALPATGQNGAQLVRFASGSSCSPACSPWRSSPGWRPRTSYPCRSRRTMPPGLVPPGDPGVLGAGPGELARGAGGPRPSHTIGLALEEMFKVHQAPWSYPGTQSRRSQGCRSSPGSCMPPSGHHLPGPAPVRPAGDRLPPGHDPLRRGAGLRQLLHPTTGCRTCGSLPRGAGHRRAAADHRALHGGRPSVPDAASPSPSLIGAVVPVWRENLATLLEAWRYPDQADAWHTVHVAKIGSGRCW